MSSKRLRVLYSFPDDLGSPGIGTTAWHQVAGLAAHGVDVFVHPTICVKAVPGAASVRETLRFLGLPVPQSLLGVQRAQAIHDRLVANRLKNLRGKVDLVHCWPDASLRTLRAALQMGVPAVLERPVAHTGYTYQVVLEEHKKLGVKLPRGHCCSYGESRLRLEEQEYQAATALLCPSDFVAKSFLDKGYPLNKLRRHQYGFDPGRFTLSSRQNEMLQQPLSAVFVARGEPWKGLHYALEAWHASSAREQGTFTIVGKFIPGYAERLGPLLHHRSVKIVGFTHDVPSYMRAAHVLLLPTIVEGSALVTYEARACGCVLLVSDAAGAPCQHMRDSLVHETGDVESLTSHINLLDSDRDLYSRLRETSLQSLDQITWAAAAVRLAKVYYDLVAER